MRTRSSAWRPSAESGSMPRPPANVRETEAALVPRMLAISLCERANASPTRVSALARTPAGFGSLRGAGRTGPSFQLKYNPGIFQLQGRSRERSGLAPGLLGAERGEDGARRGAAVERVEVDPRRSAPQQIGALQGCICDPELERGVRIVAARPQRGGKSRRDARAAQRREA